MDRALLRESLDLATRFTLNHQKPAGNFNYQYDWLTGRFAPNDNEVRQAGALWALSLVHQQHPTPETRAGLERGLRFWFERTRPGPDGSLIVRYPNASQVSTGTVALLALAVIELLDSGDPLATRLRSELDRKLDGYLGFLLSMQRRDGRFAAAYALDTGERDESPSPYFDGETLLCLARAARRLGRDDLVPVVERAARAMAESYTVRTWEDTEREGDFRAFYQWGSLSFDEYHQAQWKDHELFGDVALAMAWRMTHVHAPLGSARNNASVLEGLIAADRIAERRGDRPAMLHLRHLIDRALFKLTTWQIESPLAKSNPFLRANPTKDPLAIGGVMAAGRSSPEQPGKPARPWHELRIDVTQHQIHALLLALGHLYDPV